MLTEVKVQVNLSQDSSQLNSQLDSGRHPTAMAKFQPNPKTEPCSQNGIVCPTTNNAISNAIVCPTTANVSPNVDTINQTRGTNYQKTAGWAMANCSLTLV